MDRKEKKSLREHIGEFLDIDNTRLTDDEAEFLGDFVDSYEEEYRGRSTTEKNSYTGWSSDGKYRRDEEITFTFTDQPGIRQDYSYHDDDGQNDSRSQVIRSGREILNLFKSNKVS